MRTGMIYCATFPSNKVYIGQTIQTLKGRMGSHYSIAFNKKSRQYKTKLSCAIRKYRKKNIIWSVLHEGISKNKLNYLEIKTVLDYDSFNNGYNSTTGGNAGHVYSEKSKRKMSKAAKNMSGESRKNISKGQKGKKVSTETKRKISKTLKRTFSTEKSKLKRSKYRKRGEDCPTSKLNLKEVREIRAKYATKKYTQRKLSEEYNISRSAISLITTNKNWKNLS